MPHLVRCAPATHSCAHVLLALPLALLCGGLGAQTVLNATNAAELRTAISQANAGGGDFVVNLSPGTFVLGGARLDNANLSGDLDVTKASGNLTIAGAAAGASVVDAAFADRVLHIQGGANVTLRDLTIKDGLATDDGSSASEALGGGVLHAGSGTLTLERVNLGGNGAVGQAGQPGANGANAGDPGAFGATGAAARGGAIYGSSVTLTRCNLSANKAKGGAGGNGGDGGPYGANVAGNGGYGGAGGTAQGGGVYLASGSLVATQCTCENSVAEGGAGGAGGNAHGGFSIGGTGGQGGGGGEARGGALVVASGQADVRDCTLFANTARGGRGGNGGNGGNQQASSAQYCSFGGPGGYGWHGGFAQGGALYHAQGTLSLVQVTVSGSDAIAGDGGNGGHGGYSFFSPGGGGKGGNAGTARGGGLAMAGGNAGVANCTVAFGENTRGNAGLGGAQGPGGSIPAQAGSDGTSPMSYGGGIYTGAGIVVIDSSIFSDNISVFGVDSYGNMIVGSSLFLVSPQGTITPGPGMNIYGQDPQLQGLQPNGGPTWTHGLGALSVAIDAGSNPYSLTTDQRGQGFTRTHGPIDIGAFEYQPVSIPAPPTIASPAAALSVNTSTFQVSGNAQTGVEVRIYTDLNDNGNIDAQDTIVGTQFVAAGTAFAIAVPLAANSANNFLATSYGAAESQPADIPAITQDSVAPPVPSVSSPTAPVSVTATAFTITGNAEADTLVKVYSDLNNDGLVNGGDAVVVQYQLTGAAKAFSVPAPLQPYSANNFLVTASDAAGNESNPTDVPTITESSLPPTNAPSVTSPSAPISVNAGSYTLEGDAPADALVRVYLDLNNDGQVGTGDSLVAQQQLPVGNTHYAVSVPLAQNAQNHFVVTAQLAGHTESAAADVAAITEDDGFAGGFGAAAGSGGCAAAGRGGFAALGLMLLSLLARVWRRRATRAHGG